MGDCVTAGRLLGGGGRHGANLAGDLTALEPHLAVEGEHVARDHGTRVEDDVAVPADEVALEAAVDVGGALEHEQVALHRLVGADAEIAEPGLTVGNGEAQLSGAGTAAAARMLFSIEMGWDRSCSGIVGASAPPATACGRGRSARGSCPGAIC